LNKFRGAISATAILLAIGAIASTSPQVATLTGTGTAPSSNAVAWYAPAPVTFAAAMGYSDQEKLTVTNVSANPLYISKLTLGAPKDFGIASNGCPLAPNSLARGISCTITLNFSPQSNGTMSGNLNIYDNTTAPTQPETVALSGTTLACPVGLDSGPTPPRAAPFLLPKGQDTTVTVTSVVPPDPKLTPTSVTLLRVDSNGNMQQNLGQMYDDGTHGDVQAGDGTYATQFVFNDSIAPGELTGRSTPVHLAVMVNFSGSPGCLQSRNNDRPIDAYRPATDAENQAQGDAMIRGVKFYADQVANGGDPEAARQNTIQFLLTLPGVVGASECFPDNCIFVEMSSGLTTFVMGPTDQPLMGGGSISTTTRAYLYLKSLYSRITNGSPTPDLALRGKATATDNRHQSATRPAAMATPAATAN